LKKDASKEIDRRRKAERDLLSALQRVSFLFPFVHHLSMTQLQDAIKMF
jgi:hypothetical protein